MLKRYIVWLRRMSHSRGFGVQSPSAYRFIRYVLCEHYPYYGYDELRHEHPSLPWLVRKRMELYFRIANYRQASRLISNGTDTQLLASYVGRGCRRTRVVADVETPDDTVEIARVCAVEGCEAYVDRLLEHTDSHTILIVEDIADNPTARRIWQRLLDSPKVSVSYDLYWAGVAFFDTERFKTCYIVNF
ncbi:hypothetical protein [uncultured Prevotella sp.]|uniref:hypothetical protein n=1 Tax=uncultured Prevotella sp. TaxID=159272 RepID=UPI0025DA6C7F|nr:hypothetical protein [uncultured Prevotella sp.]